MDIISDLNAEYNETDRIKGALPIGLFGSFRRPFLELLKRHFIEKEGFKARISYDLRTKYPKPPEQYQSAYDVFLSERLLEESRIHIVIFFKEEGGEDGINDSATMELGMLRTHHKYRSKIGQYSLILCESGYDNRNIGGMRRGIRPYTNKEWQWHDFDTYEEAKLHATQFGYDCILDYSRRVIFPSY